MLYVLEHNFDHVHQRLAATLVLLNLLAMLWHTTLAFCDQQYVRMRQELVVRQTFFHDVLTLTRYHYFASWAVLIAFMFHLSFGIIMGLYELLVRRFNVLRWLFGMRLLSR